MSTLEEQLREIEMEIEKESHNDASCSVPVIERRLYWSKLKAFLLTTALLLFSAIPIFLSILFFKNWRYDQEKSFDLGLALFYLIILLSWFLHEILLSAVRKSIINKACKYFNISIEEFEYARLRIMTLSQAKAKLMRDIHRERERNFLDKIRRTSKLIELKLIKIDNAKRLLSELKEENKLLKAGADGHYYQSSSYYLSELKKIDLAIVNFENITQSTETSIIENKSIQNSPLSNNYDSISKIGKNHTNKEFKLSGEENPRVPSINQSQSGKKERPLSEEDLVRRESNSNKEISDIFGKEKKSNVTPSKPETFKSGTGKIDYPDLNKMKHEIGYYGELFALEWEKFQLKKEIKIVGNKIEHISIRNDSLGFDIASFCKNGRRKYIEVKTTTGNYNTPFYLTEREIKTLKRKQNYFIYRIYGFDMETKRGSLFIIDCKKDFEKFFKITPSKYRISLSSK